MHDDEVIGLGVTALRALALSLPLWGLWSIYGGALRGSGDTRTPIVLSAVAVWSAVGLAYAAVAWFDRGLGAVWLTFLITLRQSVVPAAAACARLAAPRPYAISGARGGHPEPRSHQPDGTARREWSDGAARSALTARWVGIA